MEASGGFHCHNFNDHSKEKDYSHSSEIRKLRPQEYKT